jgi:predicted permease
MLFVGVVTTSRSTLVGAAPFVIATLVTFVGLFLVVAMFSMFALHRSLGAAAVQAASVSFSNVFMGVPIFTPLFGESGILSVAVAALVVNATIIPITAIMLEYGRQPSAGATTRSVAVLVGRSLLSGFQKPVALAPMLAAILVLFGLPLPTEIEGMLELIGSATAGVALFVAGLFLSAHQARLTVETAGNTLVKMIVHPFVMALLVAAFGIVKPLGSEAILLCAFPTGVGCPMLALQYKTYNTEAASTMLLTTVAMIIVLPIAIALTGA